MIRRPPRSTRTYNSFPTRRSSDLVSEKTACIGRATTPWQLVGRREIAEADIFDAFAKGFAVKVGACRQNTHEARIGQLDIVSFAIEQADRILHLSVDERLRHAIGSRSEEHPSELQSLIRLS